MLMVFFWYGLGSGRNRAPAARGPRSTPRRLAFAQATDSGERHAFKARWNTNARPHGEQKFVILATIERLFQAGAGKSRRRLDVRFQAGSERQPAQIHR